MTAGRRWGTFTIMDAETLSSTGKAKQKSRKGKAKRKSRPPRTTIEPCVSELWARFCLAEHDIPLMLDMPQSTWGFLKRSSSPKIFQLGKRRYVLTSDLKDWLVQVRDQWEPKAPQRRAAFRALAGG